MFLFLTVQEYSKFPVKKQSSIEKSVDAKKQKWAIRCGRSVQKY